MSLRGLTLTCWPTEFRTAAARIAVRKSVVQVHDWFAAHLLEAGDVLEAKDRDAQDVAPRAGAITARVASVRGALTR